MNEHNDPDMLGAELTHAALYKAHTYARMECHDHAGNCCPAGCHDVAEDQFTHYARVAHPVGTELTEAEALRKAAESNAWALKLIERGWRD